MMNLPKCFPRLALTALAVLVMQADSSALTAHGAVSAGLPPPPASPFRPEAAQPGGLRIDNLRFLDDQGVLSFAADGPLPGATAGTLEFEVQFRRGSTNQRGAFSSVPLGVVWAEAEGPWKELGLIPSAAFARVHPVTGNAVASLALPLGHAAGNALPLAPGAVAVPTARQQVLKAGPSETRIHVPYGLGSELEFAIQVDVVRAPVIGPDPVQVGRVESGTPPSFQIAVDASGCLEEGEHPVATAEVFEVQQAWSFEHERWVAEVTLSARTPELLARPAHE